MDEKQDLRGLCVPFLDEVLEETEELFKMYEENIEGIDRSAILSANDEPVDFLSWYQTVGVDFADKRKRAMIADQMGVGKTPQGVALRYLIENRTGSPCPTLVLCPNSVKEYWEECIRAWSMEARAGRVVSLEAYDRASLARAVGADWVILNYDLLAVNHASESDHGGVTTRKRVHHWLLKQGFRLVILDEVQNARNSARPLSQNVMEIARKPEYLLMLSGTPVPNWLRDIFVIMALLEPEVFKNISEVVRAYRQDPRIVRAFFKRRRLKRTVAEVLKLPPLETKRVWCTLGETQTAIYQAIRENYELNGGVKLLRLKQALLDPALLPASLLPGHLRGPWNFTPTKFLKLDTILKNEIGAGNKVVVFSPLAQHGIIDQLAARYRHYGVIVQDGTMKENPTRRDLQKRFQHDPSIRLCLATDVVGEGVNLTAASVEVFLDIPYCPGDYDQMVARAHRRGQTKPVRVYELLVRNTVDEGTVEFVESKREAIQFLEEGHRLTGKHLEVMTKLPAEVGTHRSRMWTGQEYINYYASRMSGVGYEKNHRKLEQHDGEIARHYAECYTMDWDRTVSANSSEVTRRIVQALDKARSLQEKLDLGGAFGVLSHVLQKRTVVTDINRFHFETEFFQQRIAHLGNEVVITPYHDLPKTWNGRFDLAVNTLGLHQCSKEERRDSFREAWRVLKLGGYLLITLPMGTVGPHAESFALAIAESGWKVIPELTGVVHSTEPHEVGFKVLIILATRGKKIKLLDHNAFTLDCDDFLVRGATGVKQRECSQHRAGTATSFSLENGETLETRIEKYLKRM